MALATDLKSGEVTGFPSDFLDPQVKAGKDYALKWAEAMERVGINGATNGLFPGFMENTSLNRFTVWRAYARGQQPIDKYKPILGINDKKNQNDPQANSYRVQNWEILDIASKFVNVLVGRLLKQDNNIGVMAVDKGAQDERRATEIQMREYVINQKFLQGVTKSTGVGFEAPLQDANVPPPENMSEVDVFMEKFYKEPYCLIVQDLLTVLNKNDNYEQILSEVARDLIEVKTGATKVYRVGDRIMRRRCDPARMACSASNKSNFEDVKWIFEDWDLTIGQLKEIAGDQLTEAEYRDIAEKAASSTFSGIDVQAYYNQNLCYPWDNTKIVAKDCVWFSPDWETQVVRQDETGNVEVKEKPYEYWEGLRKERPGITEKSYNEYNKDKGRKVVRYAIDNQYQCLWIKNTKYVVNFGKSKDMLKNQSTLGSTVGPYTIYQLKKCIIESLIPVFDSIQTNWLQHQFHLAKSVPAGQSIEFTALQDISLEGASGAKLKPKEVLKLYYETGIMLWRRRDAAGNLSNYEPIKELTGGISDAAEKHLGFLIQGINLLREISGLNELTDASTPNSEMGKAVATMASGSTDDALRGTHMAFDEINLGTQKRTVMNISGMAAAGVKPQYVESMGVKGSAFLTLMSDLTMHELGVYLMKSPTQEMRMWINEYCKVGIQNQTLYEEEAMEIQMEPNIYRAIRLLKVYRTRKIQQKQADAQAQYQAESKKNIESIEASAQAKEAELDGQIRLAQETAQIEVWKSQQITRDEAFLLSVKAKLDMKLALSEEEQNRMTELMKIDRQGFYQVQVAKAKPKPKPAGKK